MVKLENSGSFHVFMVKNLPQAVQCTGVPRWGSLYNHITCCVLAQLQTHVSWCVCPEEKTSTTVTDPLWWTAHRAMWAAETSVWRESAEYVYTDYSTKPHTQTVHSNTLIFAERRWAMGRLWVLRLTLFLSPLDMALELLPIWTPTGNLCTILCMCDMCMHV